MKINTIKISQFLGIILYIYFISQYEHYHIFWNLPWMFSFEVIELINYFLRKLGTLFLILPLIITLISIFIPKTSSLGIISAIFGIYSWLAIILSGYLNNGSLDVYNMKPFILARILTLEEKIQVYQSIIEYYLLNYETSKHIAYFVVSLGKSKQLKEILIKLEGRPAVEKFTIDMLHELIQLDSDNPIIWHYYLYQKLESHPYLLIIGFTIITTWYFWWRFF
jgi:hypothetical protein